MGYNTTPDLIEQNQALLRSITSSFSKGQSLRCKVSEGENISTEAYRLRRVLAACDAHQRVFGGEFALLGSRSSIKINYVDQEIVISPKGTVKLEKFKPSEKDALEVLISAAGSMAVLEFWPSSVFTWEGFLSDAKRIGWLVHRDARSESADGQISVPAEKIEKEDSVGFSIFDK